MKKAFLFFLCLSVKVVQGAPPTVAIDFLGRQWKIENIYSKVTKLVREPMDINVNNVHGFPVWGSCSEVGREVVVTATRGNKSVSKGILCEPCVDSLMRKSSHTNIPPCEDKGQWVTSLDLTSLTPILPWDKVPRFPHPTLNHHHVIPGVTSEFALGDEIVFTAVHTNAAQERAQNSFTFQAGFYFYCPEGFIPVPYRPYEGAPSDMGYSFCVSKYEMTASASYPLEAISKGNNGLPLQLPYEEALSRCQDLGGSFDLLRNWDWQLVARNVELVGSNWSGGAVGSGGVYKGHHKGNHRDHEGDPQKRWLDAPFEAYSDDSQGCRGPYRSNQCLESADPHSPTIQRRTLTLSNGHVIWDLAGNTLEWIKERIIKDNFPRNPLKRIDRVSMANVATYDDWMPVLLLGSHLTHGVRFMDSAKSRVHLRINPIQMQTPRILFGPHGDYSDLPGDQGLGKGWLTYHRQSLNLVRGGGTRGESGLFSISIRAHEMPENRYGFRCTYRLAPSFRGEDASREY